MAKMRSRPHRPIAWPRLTTLRVKPQALNLELCHTATKITAADAVAMASFLPYLQYNRPPRLSCIQLPLSCLSQTAVDTATFLLSSPVIAVNDDHNDARNHILYLQGHEPRLAAEGLLDICNCAFHVMIGWC